MSAVNASISSASLDAERRAHEPSMEEILASIRRIIADDEALPVVRRDRDRIEPRALAEALRPSETTAGLDEAQSRAPVVVPVRIPQAAAPRPNPPSAAPAPEPRDFWLRPALSVEPERESRDGDEAEENQRSQDDAARSLQETGVGDAQDEPGVAEEEDVELSLEAEGSAESDEEFDQPLVSPGAAASIASHFQALAATMVISEAGVIERYARDMLRPMLKQWLDDNLPALVEKLVRAEIERVVRGRR